jgi:hypothetical protein
MQPEPSPNNWRSISILVLILVMIGALFASRFVLSVSIIAFAIVCFIHGDWKVHWRKFITTPLLWGITLLFFLPLISGMWSDDHQTWLELVRVKIPLLVLPLAFAAPFNLSQRYWDIIAFFFVILVVAGTGWSLSHYIENPDIVHEGYLRAKTMVTPLENDHVRFSWLIALAIVVATWIIIRFFKSRPIISILFAVIVIWLIVFLHILAARTGLLAFYFAAFLAAIWMIGRMKWRYGVLLMIVLVLLPVAAWQWMPTFRNRVKYVTYDFDYFKKGSYRPGSNDAVRVISINAGWHVLKANVVGVGYGDIERETIRWYDDNYPGMLPQDRIYPSSEFMMYGAGCGWTGVIVLLFILFLPLFMKTGERLLWWLLNAMILIGFLFDIAFEVQFGVFIYSFMILWFWKRFNLCK